MPATKRFSAYLVSKDEKGACHGEVRTDLALDQLPAGELLIRVDHSSINYKDALSATGNPGVTKQYPHIPGIDAVGRVAASSSGLRKAGWLRPLRLRKAQADPPQVRQL